MATETEHEQIERLLTSDPALLIHINRLNADLEHHFLQQAVPPPPAIRERLEVQAANHTIEKRSRRAYSDFERDAARDYTETKSNYVDVEVDNTHIRVHKNWRPAFIAIFILSKVFLIAALYYYFKADSQAQEITRLKTEMSQSVRK